jgi:hypothetical protein
VRAKNAHHSTLQHQKTRWVNQNSVIAMSKHLEIAPDKHPGQTLSKDQKQFNTLVKKIKAVRDDIEAVRELDLTLRRLGEERVRPAEEQSVQAARKWVLALHESPFKSRLSKKMAQKFSEIMVEEIQSILNTTAGEGDTDLQEIFTQYEGSGRTYEEIQEDKEQLMKSMAAEELNNLYGMSLNVEDLSDPAILQKMMADKQAAYEAAERARAERQARRKKSEAALAAEEKRRAAEATVKKTAKKIYMDLVRHFHPDKEQDEQLRAEKTEVMKQITTAYEADDHLQLLELQLSLLTGRDNAVLNFDKAQLRYFNQTLQRQLFELQQEYYFASPEGNGNPYARLFAHDRAQMLENIERFVRHLNQATKGMRSNARIIQTEAVFKAFVRDYELSEDWFEDLEFGL